MGNETTLSGRPSIASVLKNRKHLKSALSYAPLDTSDIEKSRAEAVRNLLYEISEQANGIIVFESLCHFKNVDFIGGGIVFADHRKGGSVNLGVYDIYIQGSRIYAFFIPSLDQWEDKRNID